MAKEKLGTSFVAGIKANMRAQGIAPTLKKPNIALQTLKYLPGEMARTTKRFAGVAIRGAVAPAKAVGRFLSKKKIKKL
jgi:hypothetical protein